MYTLGALLLTSMVLAHATTVIESILGVVQVHGPIKKIPVIGTHLSLIIGVAIVWFLEINLISGWGVNFSDDWMTYTANAMVLMGMAPLKDAIISMVSKGLRA
ncbi:MAG: hypothetical protein EBS48_01030 [Actinobacteria bacterium]|jgi:hypothetical protein|nr:hypothetical protein [Actinomycetota bacterium]NBR66456.1 hypothetical protein [Actinomycetota bacterium]NBU15594.1 hypothetical protein [Actinomycetota bacterium]